ncbi:protein EFR3 homolog B-like isoform X2 [Oppia nitens]|uniref:protein EFR3 homolog B-like isoform X2 n=1 Tax=Oppia nitens TaxID=1686743 RepID=UPI0023DB65A4|nr:protein EFR3 homolog B-like isoform X2 [Oppia nitens]
MSSLLSSINCCANLTPSEWFGGLFKQCDPSECCCGCCSALRPRYKRLVDNIYPSNPQDGLVKSNMEKLIFYAQSSPEKLDRIGDYVARKVARDLSRHRNCYVVVAMEAMDQLLVACHAQTLNLFVESFLKIIQQLLESQEPDMQILATQSFVKFANIEEDTPSYHRRYDFFVSKFSSLCHNGNNNLEIRNTLRTAGLNGLKGVIRKTVSDDLQADIWEETHMDKIVPSLLFNMQCQDVIGALTTTTTDSTAGANTTVPAAAIAEECLKELVGRAAFGHVHSVVKPILKHLDNHHLWSARHPNEFAVHSFKIIMYSIQAQHSYAVIQMLMSHLDDISRSAEPFDSQIKIRTGIVNVLSQIVAISASESIGPSVLEMINSLLHHLRTSISNIQEMGYADEEELFQKTVIDTLGEFANNLPDYQKIEIMIFITSKAPPTAAVSSTDSQLQNIILKSLLKVTTKYKTVQMTKAFPTSFLNPLLSRSLASNPKVRLTVQRIFHQLLDRHNNLGKLSRPVSLSSPDMLAMEKTDRHDLMFMKKHGTELLFHIYETIQIANNTQQNFAAIYTTLALLCVELNSEETLTELLRLTFAVQDLAVAKTSTLSEPHKSSIHCLVSGFLHLIGHLTAIPAYCAHVEQVIKMRNERTPWLLPEYSADTKSALGSGGHNNKKQDVIDSTLLCSTPDDLLDELVFNRAVISQALQSSGHDVSNLMTPFMPPNVVDSTMTRSVSDINTITVEVDSVNSSPGLPRRQPEEDITFESLRKIINEPISAKQDELECKRLQIVDRFRNSSFHDLINRYERKSNDLQHKLFETFSRFSTPIKTIESIGGHELSVDIEVNNAMDCVDGITSDVEADDDGGNDDDIDNSQRGLGLRKQLTVDDNSWHFYDNPLRELCSETDVNSAGPPLFALKFPELFVY